MNEEGFFRCVPKKFRDAEIDKCDLQPIEYREFAKKWAENPKSILLTGKAGRGKSRFAFAMIREVFRRCPRLIWPRYYTSPDLDSMLLEAVKSDHGDKYLITKVKTEDLLFLDDFGREGKDVNKIDATERLKRQYFEIINYRYAEEVPMILTSNLTLEEIGRVFNEAIASRIQEWQIIEFNGPDIRPSQCT